MTPIVLLLYDVNLVGGLLWFIGVEFTLATAHTQILMVVIRFWYSQ